MEKKESSKIKKIKEKTKKLVKRKNHIKIT